jgi:hypothetical protein
MEGIRIVPSEVMLGLGIVLVTGASFFIVQSVFNMANTIQNRYIELLPMTISSEDKQIVFEQDAKKRADAKPILPSDNERTGMEFAYSFYLNVNENNFDGSDILHPVFYKGYSNSIWPLQSPGVFIKGDTNTMRIIMPSFKDAYNHIDIENIPIGKWFHVVLNFQKLSLEVYINGKIVKKLNFSDTLPYTNYQNLIVFPNNTPITINRPNLPQINFSTAMKGKISNLIYTRYALSVGEIQNFYSKGPSTVTTAPKSQETPPYFADSWWNQ